MANDGQARVSLYLELKNRLKSGLDTAKRHLNSTVSDMKGKLKSLKTAHIEAFSAMKDEIPGFGRAIALLGNPYVLITAGLISLISLTKQAMALNHEWETGMAKVNVTAQLGKEEFHQLDRQIDEIARRNYTPYQEVPEAFNRIISAGLSVEDSLKALEPTLKAAKAGFTDVETVAAAAVSVMNSSGLKDTTHVYDVLFATLNKGNAEFKDIANYLPKIIPNARNVGVSLEQVAGAYAYMTAQGQTAEKAATLLENAFKVLGDPEKVKKFKKIGVSIYDTKGNMREVVDIATQLNKQLNGLSDRDKAKKLDVLGLDMEAASAFSIMSQDIDKLTDSIDFAKNSTGQLDQAVKNSSVSTDSLTLITNQYKSVLNDIGRGANEWLGKVAEDLLPVIVGEVNRFKEGTGIVYGIWQSIATVLGTIWSVVSTVVSLAWTILTPILRFLGTSELIRDIFIVVQKTIEFIGWSLSKLGEGLEYIWDHTIGPMIDGIRWITNKISDLVDYITPDAWKSDSGDTKKIPDEAYEIPWDKVTVTPKNLYGKDGGAKAKPYTGSDKDSKKEDGGITGGQQVRNITIQKLVFIEGNPQFTQSQLGSMSPDQLEAFFQEMIARTMVNIGRSYE